MDNFTICMECSLRLVEIIQKMSQATKTEGTDWVRGILCTGKPQEVTSEINIRACKECENIRLNRHAHVFFLGARRLSRSDWDPARAEGAEALFGSRTLPGPGWDLFECFASKIKLRLWGGTEAAERNLAKTIGFSMFLGSKCPKPMAPEASSRVSGTVS